MALGVCERAAVAQLRPHRLRIGDERGIEVVVVRRPVELDSEVIGTLLRSCPCRTSADSRNGTFLSTRGSPGNPSTRSPMMLRWIWSVPPPIEIMYAVATISNARSSNSASSPDSVPYGPWKSSAARPRRCRLIDAASFWIDIVGAACQHRPLARETASAAAWIRNIEMRDDLGGDVVAVPAPDGPTGSSVSPRVLAICSSSGNPRIRPDTVSTFSSAAAIRSAMRASRGLSPMSSLPPPPAAEPPRLLRSLASVVCATRHPSFTSPTTSSVVDERVGEEHLVEHRPPGDLAQGSHLDSGLTHVEREVGDASMLRLIGVGAGDEDRVARPMRSGCPHLLPVDDPAVAVAHGLRAQAGEVGPGAGFAEQLAPDVLAAQDPGEVAVDLLGRAMSEQGRAGEHRRDARRTAQRPDVPAGRDDLGRVVARQPATAAAEGPCRLPPAGVGEQPPPLAEGEVGIPVGAEPCLRLPSDCGRPHAAGVSASASPPTGRTLVSMP